MIPSSLKTLSMAKYARLLPRIFPACEHLEIRDNGGALLWDWHAQGTKPETETTALETVVWADFGHGIQRRVLPAGRTEFRGALSVRDKGNVGWLVVGYDTSNATPVDTAPEPMRRGFADVARFMQEEMDLQRECNQLAAELTERYEELNLVYATDDQVEHIEEGEKALSQLVHNCADYLDVGMAALICKERSIELHDLKRNEAPADYEQLLELLRGRVYDRVESQLAPVVLNELDSEERCKLLGKRDENLIAQPVFDDFGTAIGILVVIARRELHTFSNGDRNLLEVMAKKASRIIHTHHDSLTGLINRSGFESTLVTTLAATRSANLEHCLLHIDIDQLHVINDLMGHQEGDALIRRVARLLRHRLRDTDCLARLGGDEFGVLLTRCSLAQGVNIAHGISDAVRELEVIAAKRQLNVSVSIGLAGLTCDTESIVGLLASAEIACKAAKESGRDGIQTFETDNTTLVRRSEEVEWLGRVQAALRDDSFVIYSQAVVPILDENRAAHFELLLRMIGERGEILSPAEFIPAAERYQMMPMVDRWVIQTALRYLGRKWQSIAAPRPVFCINLSGQSLTQSGFYGFIVDALEANEVPASNICFEVTETAAISNIDEAISLMNALRAIGCRFSLDDFGAGLSSFGYLRKLPVNYLKIDGSFVRDITSDEYSKSMVQAISDIGRTMGLSIVAEFVENEDTIELLRSMGVDFAQGFGVGKPISLKETIRTLQKTRESQLA
ncbi:MAG: EAL domain-containing protein [Woeseiaceae bacterium]|nr:EAL domain-containing protein [Woeseiaceae bacterium]